MLNKLFNALTAFEVFVEFIIVLALFRICKINIFISYVFVVSVKMEVSQTRFVILVLSLLDWRRVTSNCMKAGNTDM